MVVKDKKDFNISDWREYYYNRGYTWDSAQRMAEIKMCEKEQDNEIRR